ncbi:MAG: metallophosphoesterase family protein, partial [Symploca sp. SIO3C6]|nr:metallophosphoesterase family protein [Symploca sp. SIO3C6]
YGPYPNAVVELIRSLDIPTCQGCWDEDIVDGLNACECSYPSHLAEKRGREAHEWTNNVIHPEVREYLASLPMTLRLDNMCFAHGSPNSQHEYLLPSMDGFAALERVLSADAEVLFCGHTHVPYVRTLENCDLNVRVQQPGKNTSDHQFQVGLKQIINAGSVGEPRHGRPNATYVVYATDTAQVTLREVPYDYEKTCAAIIDKGLPPIFAWRLARGMEFAERADDPSHVCQR